MAATARPFSRLPRDLDTDYVITLGRDRYVLKPRDATGCSRLELHRDGQPKHGYVVNPRPRRIEEFADVISNSFRPTATFLNALLLVRFGLGPGFDDIRALTIHNMTVVESQGNECREHQLSDRAELIARIVERFGMPQPAVAEVVSELGELQNVWT